MCINTLASWPRSNHSTSHSLIRNLEARALVENLEMMWNKKKPAPLMVLLAILLITTLEMVPEVAAGAKPLCDVRLTKCEDVCYKSGKCSRCCKNHGFNHGQCGPKSHCYCCRGPNSGGGAGEQQRMLKVIPASPPPPARHPPLHA